jgi:hypothetical protein
MNIKVVQFLMTMVVGLAASIVGTGVYASDETSKAVHVKIEAGMIPGFVESWEGEKFDCVSRIRKPVYNWINSDQFLETARGLNVGDVIFITISDSIKHKYDQFYPHDCLSRHIVIYIDSETGRKKGAFLPMAWRSYPNIPTYFLTKYGLPSSYWSNVIPNAYTAEYDYSPWAMQNRQKHIVQPNEERGL